VSNLVELLRIRASVTFGGMKTVSLMLEAADEIERLKRSAEAAELRALREPNETSSRYP